MNNQIQEGPAVDFYTRQVNFVRPKEAIESARVEKLCKRAASPRISEERLVEIRSLRNTQNEIPPYSMPLAERFRKFVSEVFSDFARAGVKDTTSRMCINYGHEIDHSTWTTGLPTCLDCGCTITSAGQLRKMRTFPVNDRQGKFWTEHTAD